MGLALALLLGVAFAQGGRWELRVCADPAGLPFSGQGEPGFENRIAELLAEALGARASYAWTPAERDRVRQLLAGECDLVMGVPDGYRELLTTVAYYQSPYVFVTRAGSPVAPDSLDDPALAGLRIGVQHVGIPPYQGLVRRGLQDRVLRQYGEAGAEAAQRLVADVAAGAIDVGIAWGPEAGYAAARQDSVLELVPVAPQIDAPFVPMTFAMAIGLRPGDEALRDQLNLALARRWDEVQAVLRAYGVPLDPLARPGAAPEAGAAAPRVGVVLPGLTGGASPLALAGEPARMGALMAAEEGALAAGPAGQEPLEVLLASAPSAGAARRAAERLVSEGVVALVGGLGPGQAEALADLAAARQVPLLNIGSTSEALRRRCRPYLFHVEAGAGRYLSALTAWLAGRGQRRWFVVYADDAEGRALERLAASQPAGEVVGSAAVAANEALFTAALEGVRQSGADAVLLLLDAPEQLAFTAQAAALALPLAPLPTPVGQTRAFLAAARARGGSAGAGVRVALWDPALRADGAADLNDRFAARWGQPMDPPAWAAYAAVSAVAQALAAATAADGTALVRALERPGAELELGKGPGTAFGPDHQLRQPLYAVAVDPEAPWGASAAAKAAIARVLAALPMPSGEAEGGCSRR